MTETLDFEALALSGWRFWQEAGKLRYRAAKDQINEHLLQALRAQRDELQQILAMQPDRLELAPLSHGQRALWLLDQLTPGSSAYNQSLLIYPGAGADPARWRTACRQLVERHPMLRAVIETRDGVPIQRFRQRIELPWREVKNLRSRAEVQDRLRELQSEPFDLRTGPLIRFYWIDAPGEPILALIAHHIVCDGWSFGVMRAELRADTQSTSAEAAAAPAGGRDYRDFVFWQRANLAGPRAEALWGFWSQQLRAPLELARLPIDRDMGDRITGPSAVLHRTIAGDPLLRCRRLASDLGVTLTTLALAVFFVLLHRWTRQTDLVVGMPSAGRDKPEWQGIVGYFVDPVAIRMAIDEDLAFDRFVTSVGQQVISALQHRDLPFALLSEKIALEHRTPGRALFNILFNVLPEDFDRDHPSEIPTADAKFDLTLTLFDGTERITLAFGYRADLFQPATIEALSSAFAATIEGASLQPDLSLTKLPLVPAGTAPRPVLAGKPLDLGELQLTHAQVREHARAHPDAVALRDWAANPVRVVRDLSYRALAAEVDRVADNLAADGVGAGARVALACDHSSNFIIGMLALWSLGATAVVIDPSLPEAVLHQMLTDSRASAVVITRPGTRLAVPSDLPLLPLEGSRNAHDRSHPERRTARPDDTAYIVFTSGTTGRPKGVCVSHRSLGNYVLSMREQLAIEPCSDFAVVSPLFADLGYTMVLLALESAGTLHLIPPEIATNPGALSRCFDAGIDYLKITPSHLAALRASERMPMPNKALVLGGEPSSTRWVMELLNESSCRIFNHYGPTETTIGVATHEALPDQADCGRTLALSRAVCNARLYVLDRSARPVPRGMPGVLYVAGTPLADGYVDPSDTASAFESLPGIGRCYRTGDLVRQRGDGTLVFIGRADRQVKVNGYRVELAQVEHALIGSEGVRQALVVGEPEQAAASRLVAWVVANHAARSDNLSETLRRQLQARLPAYMVPAEILITEQLALAKTGKVDARKMRDLEPRTQTKPARRGWTRNHLEMRLALIFRELLERDDIGADDSFFELGGHSVLALHLSGRILKEFGQELPLSALIGNNSVRALAMLLASREHPRPASERATILALKGGDTSTPLVLFPGAGGSLLYFEHLAARLPGRRIYGATAGRGSVEQVAEAYASALGDTIGDQPLHLAGHSFGALVAYEVARLLHRRGQATGAIVLIDNPAPTPQPDLRHDRWQDADWYAHIAARIEQLYGVRLGVSQRSASNSPTSDPGKAFAEALIGAGIFSKDMPQSQISDLVALYRDNVRAAHRYQRPSDLPNLNLHLVYAAEPQQGPASAETEAADMVRGWEACTLGSVLAVAAPGTHIGMLLPPNVDTLARLVDAILTDADPLGPAAASDRRTDNSLRKVPT